jgi:outer membrane biosynthesis protein TonB
MADPIQVNYTPDGDDWTVAVKGRGQTLTGTAVGLIAARDRADQLVEQLTPDEGHKTVVHLLNGDAVEFTTAYLTARLAKSEPPAPVEAPPAEQKQPAEKPAEKPKPAPPPAPRSGAEAVTSPERKPSPTPRQPEEKKTEEETAASKT